MSLLLQRCLNHDTREAVARCPQCRQFYCRECVTEHDGLVVCANCLRLVAGATAGRRFPAGAVARLGAAIVGLFVVWFCFYGVGRLLLAVPAEFHEGNVWKVGFWDDTP
jgi:hypothetical protein